MDLLFFSQFFKVAKYQILIFVILWIFCFAHLLFNKRIQGFSRITSVLLLFLFPFLAPPLYLIKLLFLKVFNDTHENESDDEDEDHMELPSQAEILAKAKLNAQKFKKPQ